MNHNVETVPALRRIDPQQHLRQRQMTGRRDRQKLRDPLQRAEARGRQSIERA